MITKTQKVDLGLGLPEKKKKKNVVKEPETQYSVLHNDNYFSDSSPVRTTSLSKNVVRGQASEVPLMKKKGHSTFSEESPESETRLHARTADKSPRPRKQSLGHSEVCRTKTSPDRRPSEEVTRVDKKLKKQKGKKAKDGAAFSVRDSWSCEAEDALYSCSESEEGEEQTALGQKQKQGSPREHSRKMKKKKIHQEGDPVLGHSKLSRSMEGSLGKLANRSCMGGRSNMALSKKAADSLQQNGRQDYDRTMSWKRSRGAGLGFSTAPNKIFYIDRNASRSIKLED
ncbi:hypothetical protein TREES_T100006461 [Tupaia chinensis]|uniref:Lysine-rich nucleolar protein 1 n=1 Tax=Tupaia chinensis TaxID=246437 RepID=L9KVI6_TUPCH|nr:hypothetical protein TREES_T100006461 [Tupaia chinensis]